MNSLAQATPRGRTVGPLRSQRHAETPVADWLFAQRRAESPVADWLFGVPCAVVC
jgi:hypothetical protein